MVFIAREIMISIIHSNLYYSEYPANTNKDLQRLGAVNCSKDYFADVLKSNKNKLIHELRTRKIPDR
jgi:hypothetical protein